MFHHETEFSVVLLQKTTPFRNLCAIKRSPLNICSFASSIVSLVAHEKALLMSVSEFGWDLLKEVRCHPMHSCVSVAPSLLRPRRKPCQFGEKCSFSPSETVSLTIAAMVCKDLPGSHRQMRWRCTDEEEFYWRARSWRCPAPVPFRQLFCSVLKRIVFAVVTVFMSNHSRAVFSLRFSNVDHLSFHSSHRAEIVTLVFISSFSGREPGK